MPKIVGYVGETPPTGEQPFPWLPTLAVFAGAWGALWLASRLGNRLGSRLVANAPAEFAPETLTKIREATRRARAGEAKIALPAEIVEELSKLPPGRYTFDLDPDFEKRQYWDAKLVPPGYRPKKWRRERWRRYKSSTTLRGAFLSASRAADGSDSRHVLVDTIGEPTGDAASPYTAAPPVVLGVYREDGEPVFLIHADILTPPPELSKEARQARRTEKKASQEARKARRAEREAAQRTRAEKAAEKREQRIREREQERIEKAENKLGKQIAQYQQRLNEQIARSEQARAELQKAAQQAKTSRGTQKKEGGGAAERPASPAAPTPAPTKTPEQLEEEKKAAARAKAAEIAELADMSDEERAAWYKRQLARPEGKQRKPTAPVAAPAPAEPAPETEPAPEPETEAEAEASVKKTPKTAGTPRTSRGGRRKAAEPQAEPVPAEEQASENLRKALQYLDEVAAGVDETGATTGYQAIVEGFDKGEGLGKLIVDSSGLDDAEQRAFRKYLFSKAKDESKASEYEEDLKFQKLLDKASPEEREAMLAQRRAEAAARKAKTSRAAPEKAAVKSPAVKFFEDLRDKTEAMGTKLPADTLVGMVIERRGGKAVTNFGSPAEAILIPLDLPQAKPGDIVSIIAERGEDGEIASLRVEIDSEAAESKPVTKNRTTSNRTRARTSLNRNSRATDQDPALYREFQKTINMTGAEIDAWRKNPQHLDASLPHIRAELPLMAQMKRTKMRNWTPKMWNKAMRAVNFVTRHEAQMKVQGKRYNTGPLHVTYKRIIGLLNWGRKTPGVNIKKVLASKASRRMHPNVRVMRPFRFAAGMIVFAQSTGRMLLLLRSQRVSEPMTWDIPGGLCNSDVVDEPLLQCALREFAEETQSPYQPRGPLSPFFVLNRSDLSYSTFIGYVPDEFEAELDWEHDGYGWFSLDSLPAPLHYGVQAILEHAGYELARMQPKR